MLIINSTQQLNYMAETVNILTHHVAYVSKFEGTVIEFWAFEATLFLDEEFGKCTSKSMLPTTFS